MVRTVGPLRYAAAPVPEKPEALPNFLREELTEIQNGLNAIAEGQLDVVNAAPAKPRSGMSRYADGTSWDPGSGEGMYDYYNGAWHGRGAGSPGGATTQVQFNDAGSFGGDADFTWDKTNNILTLGSAATTPFIRSPAGTGGSDGVGLFIKPGDGNGAGAGGLLFLIGASAGATGVGGGISLQPGDGGSTSGAGGDTTIGAGSATSGAGGATNISAGQGVGGVGGQLGLTAGASNHSSGAGHAFLRGGDNSSSGVGGDVRLSGGASTSGTPGHVVLNGTGSALATTATGGFVTIPTCAGTPTGVPANILTGNAPMVYDTTGFKLWIYDTGAAAWKGVVVA